MRVKQNGLSTLLHLDKYSINIYNIMIAILQLATNVK